MEVDVLREKWYWHTTYALRTKNGNADLVFDNIHGNIPMLYNLWVREGHRKGGEANALLDKAIEICKKRGFTVLGLEWDRRDSRHWVFDWYLRKGFDEKSCSEHSALLIKDLTK